MCIFSWLKKASRNETQKWQSIDRKSFTVNSKWVFQFDEKMLFNMSVRFMFARRYQKQIWLLWFYWWWCIKIEEIFRANCRRVSWGWKPTLTYLTPRKPTTTKVWRRYYCNQDLVTWNWKSSFDTLWKVRRWHRWYQKWLY